MGCAANFVDFTGSFVNTPVTERRIIHEEGFCSRKDERSGRDLLRRAWLAL